MNKKNQEFSAQAEMGQGHAGGFFSHPYGNNFINQQRETIYNQGNIAFPYDIYQEGENLVIEAPMPGLIQESLRVVLENRYLRIRGESGHSTEGKIHERNYLRHQVPCGIFDQTLLLPVEVKQQAAQATYSNGILRVVLALSASVQANPINVSFK